MDLDTKPATHPDQQPKTEKRRVAKAIGLAAIIVAVLAVAMFVGFNAFYVGQAS